MTQPKMITYNGETHAVNEWARIYGMLPATLHTRLNQGMDIGEALTKPVKVVKATAMYNGREMSFADLAKLNGIISRCTAYDRFLAGWTPEEIVNTPNNKRRSSVSADSYTSAAALAKMEREAAKESAKKAAERERQKRLHKPDKTQCKTCQFRSGKDCDCDYSGVTGRCRLRISPPSPRCTVYVKGNPIVTEEARKKFRRESAI